MSKKKNAAAGVATKPPRAPRVTNPISKKIQKEQDPIVLKNVLGEDMDPKDYFFKEAKTDDLKIPPFFNKVVGVPVDREDLLEVFNKIFKPEDGFLFYKAKNKEVYVVVVPLKYAQIGTEHDSRDGDHQKHAISFIAEGSANPEILKTKLTRVVNNIKYNK